VAREPNGNICDSLAPKRDIEAFAAAGTLPVPSARLEPDAISVAQIANNAIR